MFLDELRRRGGAERDILCAVSADLRGSPC